jgi:hypothetical protein
MYNNFIDYLFTRKNTSKKEAGLEWISASLVRDAFGRWVTA